MPYQIVYTYNKNDGTEISSTEIGSITGVADPCIEQKTSYNNEVSASSDGPFMGFTASLSEDGKTLTVYETWSDRDSYQAFQNQPTVQLNNNNKQSIPNSLATSFTVDIVGRTT